MDETQRMACRYTNLANPYGPDGSNLPLLLRRFADQLEEEQVCSDDILHLVIGGQMTEHGSWWDITAYIDDAPRDGETDD